MLVIRNRKINPTMIELIIGIAIYGIVGEILLIGLNYFTGMMERLFRDDIVFIAVGFLIGIILAVILVMYMNKSVETAVEMGETGALKHTLISSIIRYVIVVGIIVLLLTTHIGNVFAMLLGALGLKLSAYVQPVTHKVREKLKKGR